ncbi:P30/P32 family tip organella adhesin [[Mycoplasma] imitans]|uniref:P30/P32 family tip organella adhesin n=1 Tax=[Mycoplasma] imitans TaxID=29560 RepID=UPI00048A0D44|nr:P30/P32 family tip organella adhesin [[Mycoplasma] imitans]
MFSIKKLKSKFVGISFVFSGVIALGTGMGLTSEHKSEHSPSLVLQAGEETNSVGPRKITSEAWFYPVVGAGAGLIVVSLLLGLGIGIPIAKKKERMMIQEREEHQRMVESLGALEEQNKTEEVEEATEAVSTQAVNPQEQAAQPNVNVLPAQNMGMNPNHQQMWNQQQGFAPQQMGPQGFGGQMGMQPGFNQQYGFNQQQMNPQMQMEQRQNFPNQMPPQMRIQPRQNFPNQMPMNQPAQGFRPQGMAPGQMSGARPGFNNQAQPMGANRMNYPNQGMRPAPQMGGPRPGFPPQNGPR